MHTKNKPISNSDIAIVGMAVRFPEAKNYDVFWDNLCNGKESVRDLPDTRKVELEDSLDCKINNIDFQRFGYVDSISGFDSEYFNISEEESKIMDPQQRWLLELTDTAILDAGYTSTLLRNSSVGVFIANSTNHYSKYLKYSPMNMINSVTSAPAGRIAYTFDFKGPVFSTDSACSSSLTSLHYAIMSLRNSECDYAVVGGCRLSILPVVYDEDYLTPIQSKRQRVSAFDETADGTIGGEGGAVIVIKLLKDAIRDNDNIHCIIKNTGINSNGNRSNGMNSPNQTAQSELIVSTLKKSGLDTSAISYIEAHGTGTVLGDPVEASAMQQVFKNDSRAKNTLPIGSVKSNIGHLDSVSGLAGLIKAVLCIKNKKIPKSINFTKLNPLIDFKNSPLFVNESLIDWKPENKRRALVTSLGLIGTNTNVILEEADFDIAENYTEENIFTFSNENKEMLEESVLKIISAANKHENLNNVAFTLNLGRNHYSNRFSVVAESYDSLEKEVQEILQSCKGTLHSDFIPKKVGFIFQNITANDIDPTKLLSSKVFAKHYLRILDITKNPLFSYYCGYAEMLISFGVEPSTLIGIQKTRCIAEYLENRNNLDYCLKQFNKGEYENFQKVKLKELINKLEAKDFNVFYIITSKKEETSLKDICQSGSKLKYIFCNEDKYLNLISEMYNYRFDLNWEMIYSIDSNRKRISLPTYDYNHKHFFNLENIPSGYKSQISELKTDRKNISHINEEMLESEIFDIFKGVFGDELSYNQSIDDNYFDSISIMQVIARIKMNFGANISFNLFYRADNVRKIIKNIISEVVKNKIVTTSKKEFSLDIETISIKSNDIKSILITGVTGFLGAHLLVELLNKTESEIYCLVRSHESISSSQRFRELFIFYFNEALYDKYSDRINLVTGDVSRNKLGLNEEAYFNLANNVDTVIHSAGYVKHQGAWDEFYNINVKGTNNIIDFCLCGKAKKMHHMSTYAIAGSNSEEILFKENDFNIGQNLDEHVYSRSKFIAEKNIIEGRAKKLNCSIYRVGNLVGRYSDGQFQKNIGDNSVYNMLKAFFTILKKVPSSFESGHSIELLPVDICSEMIVDIILGTSSEKVNYHILNPQKVKFSDIRKEMEQFNYAVESCPDKDIEEYVSGELRKNLGSKELNWLYMTIKDKPVNNLKISTEFTESVLEMIGYSRQIDDQKMLNNIIKYCLETNYFSTGGGNA